MPTKQDFWKPPHQLLDMATAVAIAKDDIDNDSDELFMSLNSLQEQGYGSNTRLPPDKQCVGKKKSIMVEQKMRSILLFSAAADYGHVNEIARRRHSQEDIQRRLKVKSVANSATITESINDKEY